MNLLGVLGVMAANTANIYWRLGGKKISQFLAPLRLKLTFLLVFGLNTRLLEIHR
jgi:hypothetical protein